MIGEKMNALEEVKIHGQVFTFPYESLLPPLSATQYLDLKADIEKRGVIVPIVVNEANEVIDGQHRLKIAYELKINHKNIPFQMRSGISPDDQTELAFVLNLHRRHLTRDQRQEWVLKLRDRGWSTTKIAEAVGVSSETVRTDLECSASRNLEPEQVTGTDSKSYPSARPTAEHLNARQERVKQAKAEGSSVRQIAKEEGVSVGTVAADLSRPSVVNVLGVSRVKETSSLIQRAPEEAKGYTNFKDLKRTVTRTENRAKRMENIKRISEGNSELSLDVTYPVILADPPWQYEHQKRDCDKIENHYPTMTLEDICNLPVSEIASDLCVLFMWVTPPKAREAMDVLDAWGFTYKTQGIWVKDKIGQGYWFRQKHEPIFVATKGSFPPPEASVRIPSVFELPKGKHSEKPPVIHEYLEAAYPDLEKLEMFCREPREGWKVWGNQSNG